MFNIYLVDMVYIIMTPININSTYPNFIILEHSNFCKIISYLTEVVQLKTH